MAGKSINEYLSERGLVWYETDIVLDRCLAKVNGSFVEFHPSLAEVFGDSIELPGGIRVHVMPLEKLEFVEVEP